MNHERRLSMVWAVPDGFHEDEDHPSRYSIWPTAEPASHPPLASADYARGIGSAFRAFRASHLCRIATRYIASATAPAIDAATMPNQ